MFVIVQPGEEYRHAELVVALRIGVAPHHHALGVDARVDGVWQVERNAQAHHQRDRLHGMAKHAIGADVVHMVEHTGAAGVHHCNALAAARIPPPFVSVISHDASPWKCRPTGRVRFAPW